MSEVTVVTHVCTSVHVLTVRPPLSQNHLELMGVSGIQSTGVPDECVKQAVSAYNGTDLYRTAVNHALTIASDKLQKTAEKINTPLSESRYLKMDETSMSFNGKR